MTTIHDVEPGKLITLVSKDLASKEELKAPEWAKFVKTGRHKLRPPQQANWWYLRLAAILRTVSVYGPVGVERLRTKYGGAKRFKRKPKRSVKASGKIIRKALQQLQAAGLIKINKDKKGRIITKKGQSILDKTASKIVKEKTAPAEKK